MSGTAVLPYRVQRNAAIRSAVDQMAANHAATSGAGGAMEIVKVIGEAHEGAIVALAYNKNRREIYSAADGDKVIKVRPVGSILSVSWYRYSV